MRTSLSSEPLINLLRIAVTRGVFKSWDVDGHHFVFQRESDWFYVHPVAAGSFVRALLEDSDYRIDVGRNLKRVSLN
jgi:hypothetical protein